MEVRTESEVLSFAPEIRIGASQGYTGRQKVKRNVKGVRVMSLELRSSPGEGRRPY